MRLSRAWHGTGERKVTLEKARTLSFCLYSGEVVQLSQIALKISARRSFFHSLVHLSTTDSIMPSSDWELYEHELVSNYKNRDPTKRIFRTLFGYIDSHTFVCLYLVTWSAIIELASAHQREEHNTCSKCLFPKPSWGAHEQKTCTSAEQKLTDELTMIFDKLTV